ncbi:MAG: C4-dicarboxylate ABC transporter [Desulfobacteraceae bacterium IS3]|nr:MAG: C4-dicarboxylate ABC transporter [Desulfobacteraceae bacterium IS3]
MSPEIMTAMMFGLLILFILTGIPLAFALAATATITGLIDYGFNIPALAGVFMNNTWGVMNNFVIVAVPLFILMAQLLERSQISEALFEALYIVIGKVNGGLAIAVILVCVILAATTGIIGASVVGMTLLAVPTMLEKGYQKEMVAGLVCSGGTLGILIPPSIMLVVYGGLTGLKETSVGNLFAGAVFPGLILAGLYLVYVWVRCSLNPKLGPPISAEEALKYSAKDKLVMTVKSLIPPLFLIFSLMGSILGGVATPSEAAALGVIGAGILAAFYRKLSLEVIIQSSFNTLKITSMVMLLFVGGNLFSSEFLAIGGGDVITDMLVGGTLKDYPIIVLAIMLTAVFMMGMFIDWVAILLITIPVFTPIAMDLGFDPLWFSMLVCVMLQTSFLTPPFGYALFYFAGAAPSGRYDMLSIYKGVIPFVILQIIGVILCIIFPSIITYLPAIFFGK